MTAAPLPTPRPRRGPALVGAVIVATIVVAVALYVTHSGPFSSAPTGSTSQGPPADFPVSFAESGLTPGQTWSVRLGGTTNSSNATSIGFAESNGTYSFSVSGPAGDTITPANGTVQVVGRAIVDSVSFFCFCSAQQTLTVGGSAVAYPFSALAAEWFEQNNSDVVVSVNQGGSDAGMLAVCAGQVDVGVSSTPETVGTLDSQFGCQATPVIGVGAYGVVDVVVGASDPHGLLSISSDTLTLLYDRASSTSPTLIATTENGATLPANYPEGSLAWDNLPAAVAGAEIAGVAEERSSGYGPLGGPGQAAGMGRLSNDIVTPADEPSPCGWTICAGPFATNGSVSPSSEVDPAETDGVLGSVPAYVTQAFEARLLGAVSPTAFATNFSTLGFQGCGNQAELSDCGIAVDSSFSTSAELLEDVAADPNSIGYAPDSLARSASGVGTDGIVPFLARNQTLRPSNASTDSAGGVLPTLGENGSIAAGVDNSTNVSQYAGWIPFVYVTVEPLTGEPERYLQFLYDPATNAELCLDAGGLTSPYSL